MRANKRAKGATSGASNSRPAEGRNSKRPAKKPAAAGKAGPKPRSEPVPPRSRPPARPKVEQEAEIDTPWITDAQWQHLLAAAASLLKDLYEDLSTLARGEPFNATLMSDMLPRRYTLKYDLAFARGFVTSAAVVGYKLARSPLLTFDQTPSSVAEEIVLWYIVGLATESASDHGVDPQGLDALEDLMFQDTDFLSLYDNAADGIQDSEAGKMMGMGRLDFSEWFLPFNNAEDWPQPYLTFGQE